MKQKTKWAVTIAAVTILFFCCSTQAATLAHWDFNDPGLGAADGAAVPDSDGQTVWREAATDKSGNGNDLTTWEWDWAGFNWSSDSPAGDFSIETAGDYPAAMTWSEQSLPAGTNIEAITPAASTIEAVVKLSSIDGSRAPLYFSVRDWYGAGNQSLAIEFTDVQGYTHSAGGNGLSNFAFDIWYHVAAVSDGSTLKLYIEGVEVASDDMTVSGSTDTRLAVGNGSGDDWEAGTFTLARGLWDDDHTDRWYGKIDEVAISDAALEPASFVIQIQQSPPTAPSGLAATAGNNTVTLNWDDNTEYVSGYTVYRSTTSGGPYTPVASDLSDSIYRDDTVVNGITYYYVVTAVGAFDNESDQSAEVSATPYVPDPRYMEKLDRGVVAVYKGGGQVYVGWRMFGTDPETIAFNVYRNETKINSSPVTNSTNYIDYSGSTSYLYHVRAVIDGEEQPASETANVWSAQYLNVPLQVPPGPYVSEDGYTPGDVSVGDLDGDGQYEIVLKWQDAPHDNVHEGYTNSPILDAYKIDGTFLWRIDLGINIREGAHYTQFMVYDLDSDGRVEVACKTAPGTVDGEGNFVILPGDDPNADYRNGDGRILDGPEYLTIFDGLTGAELVTTNYIPPRGDISSWGDSTGNRVDRFLACVAYLDGERPSLVMCRGYYARTALAAWDWRGGELTVRWVFDTSSANESWSDYEGQGNHNLSVADVDGDGKDEIIYGSCTIDDDGTGLYTTGLGHGDALHVSDMDPGRPGLEVFACHESFPYGTTLRDAGTGEILWQKTAGGDTGRCCAAHIDSRYPGYQMWSVASGGTYNATDQSLISTNLPNWGNFLIWWDGDLQREILDDISGHSNPYIDKWYGDGAGRLLSLYNIPTAYSTASINGSKGNPCLSGDILGDWREECIYRSSDNTKLRIFTTADSTGYRIYTLMHDPQYRLAIAWQNVGYNQPPHPGFYIGQGMSVPPTPDIKYPHGLYGDFNGNGIVDTNDLSYFDSLWLGDDCNQTAEIDLNGDCIIDFFEFSAFADNWLVGESNKPVVETEITIQEYMTGFCSADGYIENEHSGYTGTGYVNTDNAIGNGIDWKINVVSGGTYTFVWRYANGGSIDRTGRLLVIGSEEAADISFANTGGWTSWGTTGSVEVTLSEGIKEIRLEAETSSGLANIDNIEVSGPGLYAVNCL